MNDASDNTEHGADDQAIDLSVIDPSRDTARMSERVSAIMRASSSHLAERRAGAVWSRQVVQWRKPLLAACSLAAAASFILLAQPRTGIVAPDRPANVEITSALLDDQPSSIAEAIGVPTSIAQMMNGGDAQQLLLSTPSSR